MIERRKKRIVRPQAFVAAAKSATLRTAAAKRRAEELRPHLEAAMEAAGSYLGAAGWLNERGIKAPRGGDWQATTMRNTWLRLQDQEDAPMMPKTRAHSDRRR
jgi:hypothetical protein